MTIVIYKLGGSLLTLPDLSERLQPILSRRGERPLLIVGGGEAADLARRWDQRFQIGEERAHWLALRAMSLNERLVTSILPRSRVVTALDEAHAAWEMREIPILCAHDFLAREEAATPRDVHVSSLPHTWDVTSDSIAAWVAIRFRADRLVLLKSCELRETKDGGVDPFFSHLAPRLRAIEWINLRAEPPQLVAWIANATTK